MTTTVNGQLLKDMFKDTTITVTEAEILEDQAINMLNTYGAGLAALTGVAGSKTGTYTSAQVGAIMTLTREVYATLHKNPSGATSANLGAAGTSHSSQNLLLDFAERLVTQLNKVTARGSPPIVISNDPVPT